MPRVKTGNKRERILDAAIELFSQGSYQETSVGQIARRAKIAAGTLYLYFPGKEELLLGIFQRFMDTYDSDLSEKIAATTGATEKFETLLRSDLEVILETPYRARLFLFELRKSAACLTFIKERLIRRYQTQIEQICSADHLTPAMPSHLLAVILSGMVENLLYDQVLGGNRPAVEQAFESIMEYIKQTILNRPRAVRSKG